MRWPWSKRKPPPTIPPYTVPVAKQPDPKEPGIVVHEHDASALDEKDLEALRLAQSQTGLHRAWNRLSGKLKE
jgi:hypothetical protein